MGLKYPFSVYWLIFMLFNDTVSTGKVLHVKGGSHDIFQGALPSFAWRD
jgi:hypothetical protein